MIETLFGPGVVTETATEQMWDAPLFAEEEPAVRRAVSKRRREFAAGRACARRALARLGFSERPLPVGPDRLPVWPAGVVGSIAHCPGWCGVAVARRGPIVGLGLDAEPKTPLEPAVAERIGRPEELAALDALPAPVRVAAAKLLFCAKEATYKCVFPLTRTRLGFADVRVVFGPAPGTFTATLLAGPPAVGDVRGVAGRWAADERWLLTGVRLDRPGPAG